MIGLLQGVPTYEPIISDVQEGGPALEAGMQDGDLVTKIDGQSINSWQDLASKVQASAGEALSFEYVRDGEVINSTITPKTVEQEGKTFGQIGVLYESPVEKNPLKAVAFGAEQTVTWIVKIFELLGMLVTGQFTIDALSGPVGIYKATEQVAQYGVFNLMNWAAILSINLGIMNLLPLPALDGGRLLFFLIEAVRGKPVDRQKEGMVHFVGIMLLMVLMVVVTWNDIQRFFF
jgi:regulator of sigma E protease